MALNIIVEDSKHCTPCKTKDKKVDSKYYCTDCEAYYCEECFELHPRVPYLAKHIVLKHDDIAVWSKLQYKCTTHDKNLEFFCGNHKTLCCHVCVSLKHRSCVDMEYMLESAKNVSLNDEITTMIQRTEENLLRIETYAHKMKHKIEVNEKSKDEYIKELEEYRSKLNNMFDVLVRNALEEMNVRVEGNTKYSEERTQELKNFEQELQDLKRQLTTSTAGKEVLIYISLKRGEKRVEEITRQLAEVDITTEKDNFKPVFDDKVHEYVGNIKQIVSLEDELIRKEAACKKECLVQSAVSSEEYQEEDSVTNEYYTSMENSFEESEVSNEKFEISECVSFGGQDVTNEEYDTSMANPFEESEVSNEKFEISECVSFGGEDVTVLKSCQEDTTELYVPSRFDGSSILGNDIVQPITSDSELEFAPERVKEAEVIVNYEESSRPSKRIARRNRRSLHGYPKSTNIIPAGIKDESLQGFACERIEPIVKGNTTCCQNCLYYLLAGKKVCRVCGTVLK